MNDPDQQAQLVARLRERGVDLTGAPVRMTGFGDSAELSASLIALIQAGAKRATCSLQDSWTFDGERLPVAGDFEIVMDFGGRPVLVLRTTEVRITAFQDVPAAFAIAEGEGDLSLDSWRREHWRFFLHECARVGRTATQDMPLVCEWFEVVAVLNPDDDGSAILAQP
ncbi:ASCH domain-containing protein [Paraburkholderia ferrariae]|jgi:uncharacterized protein YhfF|uniref:ASCH domain-containing protein n=1 Tax=Paraburkholderia ferrariae TaxID=386056 RepID=UPI0006941D23|nr:ASCH domain-containing protein [Paraburkholderia ferrariae]